MKFSKILQKSLKYCKNLQKICNFLNLSGAKVYKSCTSRSRKMLKNDYLVAKIGFDTAENEPCKVWPASQPLTPPLGRINSYAGCDAAAARAARRCPRVPEPRRGWERSELRTCER